MIHRGNNQKGFTIVELMIATAVFGSVLLVCTYGLIEIGRAYYKGVTVSRNQETARKIIEDVSSAIKYSYGTVDPANKCIGKRFYQLDASDNKSLKASDVTSCSPGGVPSDEVELLPERTRLLKFDISQSPTDNNEYTVTIKVATGADDDLTGPPIDDNSTCKSERGHSAFCATTELSVKVLREV